MSLSYRPLRESLAAVPPALARAGRLAARVGRRVDAWGTGAHGCGHAVGDCWGLQLSTGDGEALLRLDRPSPALALVAGVKEVAMRDALATLIVGERLAPSLKSRLERARFIARGDQRLLGTGLVLVDRDETTTVLAVDDRILDTLERALPHSGVAGNLPSSCAGLRLPGWLVLAGRRPSLALWRSLRPGDVLLTGQAAGMAGPGRRVRWCWGSDGRRGRWAAPCDYREGQIMLKDAFEFSEDDEIFPESDDGQAFDESGDRHAAAATEPADTQAVEGKAAADSVALPSLERLLLPLAISVPAPSLTLAELSSLSPGMVLPLPCRLDDATVRLSIHGQCVAQGEFVEVGGCLGVRLVRVSLPANVGEPS